MFVIYWISVYLENDKLKQKEKSFLTEHDSECKFNN